MNVSAKRLKSFAAGKSAEYMNFYRHLSNNSKFTIEKREEPRKIFHLIEPLIEMFKQFFHISIRHFFSISFRSAGVRLLLTFANN